MLCVTTYSTVINFSHTSYLEPFREAFWSQHGYTSLNVVLDSSDSGEESEEEEEEEEGEEEGRLSFDSTERQLHYVVGDVTQPQVTEGTNAIVVHCVGEW